MFACCIVEKHICCKNEEVQDMAAAIASQRSKRCVQYWRDPVLNGWPQWATLCAHLLSSRVDIVLILGWLIPSEMVTGPTCNSTLSLSKKIRAWLYSSCPCTSGCRSMGSILSLATMQCICTQLRPTLCDSALQAKCAVLFVQPQNAARVHCMCAR
jgi:hypothetical protein